MWLVLLMPVSRPALYSIRAAICGVRREVGTELGLVGEGALASGAGSVVGAGASDFELEVRNDGEGAAGAVDAEAEQPARSLLP